jgi:sarcosine oxidase subunit gamma
MPEIHSPLTGRYKLGCHPAGTEEPAISLAEIVGWDLVQAAAWRPAAASPPAPRPNGFAALAQSVETALGVAPPSRPNGVARAAGIELLSVAPDRLWCLAPAGGTRLEQLGEAVDAATGCITELGHSHLRVRLAGPATRALLMSEIALDLAPTRFPADTIARAPFHHVPVVLQCLDADAEAPVFDLYLPHTYAASIWEYLLDLASVHTYRIGPRAHRDGSPAGDR